MMGAERSLRDYWSGIVDGAAAAAAIAVVAAFGFGELRWKEDENLISGIAALGAAFATVRVINRQILESTAAANRQIAQTAELEAQRRRAKNLSQRASLPGALSALSDFLTNEVEIWNRLYRPSGTSSNVITALPPPRRAPSHSVAALIDCIEFADGSAIEALAALVEQIQIYEARAISLSRALVVTSFNIENMIIDVIGLHARIDSLFGYGRRHEAPAPLRYGTSARLLGYEESTHPRLFETLWRLGMVTPRS